MSSLTHIKQRTALTVLALGLVPAVASAQGGREVGLGYVVNAPELMAGVTVQELRAGSGFGGFIDVKLDVDDPGREETFIAAQTSAQVVASTNHVFFQDDDGWFSISGGLMRRLFSERLIGYAGAGYTRKTHYVEYRDPTSQLGRAGFYWVEDPDGSAVEVNVLGGLVFVLSSRVRVRMGAERVPAGVSLAGVLAFPVP